MGDRYYIDLISALAERTIKRLWIIIILLVVLLVGTNAAWLYYEKSFADEVITQEVRQDADEGYNQFVGGDYYGTSDDTNNG